ncbi:MAG: KAP family NTPase [Muribaculaceae bacterium]|nr:KAP family NTPase [Muribaculaceae bacterium]
MEHIYKTSLSDMPLEKSSNDFGTKPYVDGLIEFIERSDAPITIALQGEWGSGKTSLMNNLREALCGEGKSFIGVEVNTWEYSMLSSPEMTVVRILEHIIDSIAKDNPDLKNKVKTVLFGIGNFALGFAREATKIAFGNTGAKIMEGLDVKSTLPEPENNQTFSISDLRREIKKAIDLKIKHSAGKEGNARGKKGVIVFVDDLDRLNPPVAVEILELLKNVFTIEKCIFVLAIDYEVVVKGLEPKFGKMTNRNEREFRSFFDKIIQVPFSLPVNSYQPMTFIQDSLKDIGYLPKAMQLSTVQEGLFADIVKASVGNNPRSIKRLINTLSLLDCITLHSTARIEKSVKKDTLTEQELKMKLLNFIIVAIQICYPRIYTLLVHKPNFKDWNREFAVREGIDSAALIDDDNPDWTDILEAACSADAYLEQRYLDISKLFMMMRDIVASFGKNANENIGEVLKEILDKTFITGVRSNVNVEEFDRKTFIQNLYENVGTRIQERRPDIESLRFRNNTGNGGFKFKVDDGSGYNIKFVPSCNSDDTITLKIEMSTRIMRSEAMKGMSLDEMLKNPVLAQALSDFDSSISPLLQGMHYFNSVHSKEDNSSFMSFSEELRYLHEAGHMSGDITHDAVYLINLPKPSDFENREVVDAIADMVIANYDFRNSMKDWR